MTDDTIPPLHDWKDGAAEELYLQAGGGELCKAHSRLSKALASQSAKLEEHYNTPFSEDNARRMQTTVETLRAVSDELDRWHYRIYPYLPERP